jgi:hypothetical protein
MLVFVQLEYQFFKIQQKLIHFFGKKELEKLIEKNLIFINRDQITKISFKRRTFYVQLVKNLVSIYLDSL